MIHSFVDSFITLEEINEQRKHNVEQSEQGEFIKKTLLSFIDEEKNAIIKQIKR